MGSLAVTDDGGRLEREFAQFHAAHPEVWREFEELTIKAIRAKRTTGSADMILHVIRFNTWLGARDATYRINNNYSAFYSRMWAERHPLHANFFRRRTSAADRNRQEEKAP